MVPAGPDCRFRLCRVRSAKLTLPFPPGCPGALCHTAGLVALALAAIAVSVTAQEREDRTLLSHDQMTAIINEVSGEQVKLHVQLVELVCSLATFCAISGGMTP